MTFWLCIGLQISDTVYPMYKAYIEPDLKEAQLRIFNTFNPFSGFQNATYILKSAKAVTEEQIKAVLQVLSCFYCPSGCGVVIFVRVFLAGRVVAFSPSNGL